MKKLFTLLILVGSLFSVPAATFYVDGSVSATGNGTSWSAAWKNVTDVKGVKADDVVLIAGGTYSFNQWSPIGGTQGHPVIYRAASDARKNSQVIFDGKNGNQSSWIFANSNSKIAWVTVDGNVGNSNHITVQNYWNSIYCDDSAQGIILRYIIIGPQLRAYRCNQFEYDHLICGPVMSIDRQVVGLGSGSSYNNNLIHDCTFYAYYQHNVNSTGGNGDDILANIDATTIKNCKFISVYVSSYIGSQHQDFFQNGQYVWFEGNYLENPANYGFYGELFGSGGHQRVINNVINYTDAVLASQPTQAISIGSSAAGITISDIIIANNTIYGGNMAIALGQGYPNTHVTSSYVVNNLMVNNGGLNGLTGQGSGLQTIANKAVGGSVIPANSISPANNNPVTFVSIANKDFHLASNDTGAKDGGSSWPSAYFTTDKDGASRPQGSAWDLGAYEFGGTVSTNTNNPPPVLVASFTASPIVGQAPLTVQFTDKSTSGAVSWNWDFKDNSISILQNPTHIFQSAGTYNVSLTVGNSSTNLSILVTNGPVTNPPTTNFVGLSFNATNYSYIKGISIVSNSIVQTTAIPAPSVNNMVSYSLNIINAGDYVLQAFGNAPDTSANSYWIVFDTATPVDPDNIWDAPISAGFQNSLVSWRGATGSPDTNIFSPKIFTFTKGVHTLNLFGREAGFSIKSFNLIKIPTTPQNLKIQ